MVSICPKFEKCPIFREKLNLNKDTLEIYKNKYCFGGEQGYSQCRRFIIAQKTHTPPPTYVLPNSLMTDEEIIERMKNDGLL